MQTRATYYNGRSSTRQEVLLVIAHRRLHLSGPGGERSWPLDEVRLSAPLGSLDRTLYLPDGGSCTVSDGAFVQHLEQGRGRARRTLHRWERSLKLAGLALVVTIGVAWGCLRFGIPLLAEAAADALPPAAEQALGRESLNLLDETLFLPSTLSEARRADAAAVFERVRSALREPSCRLVFRSSPRMGANALALPGGIVVVTDQFFALIETEQELAAVLAHEIGHVRERHIVRRLFQNMGAGLVIATLTGDLTSVSALAATLPTALVETRFSRDMERQADDVAAAYLRSQGDTTAPLIAVLTKLDKASGGDRQDGLGDYLATHPGTGERIERIGPVTD